MYKFTAQLVCLLATLIPLSGQEPAEGEARGIQLRGFAFSLFEDIVKLELRLGESQLGELPLETGQLKNPISVTARQFTFGVTNNEIFRPLGSVTLPQAGKSFILVFTPTRTGYQVQIVRADDPEFRGDDIYLFNFSNQRVGVMLGEAKQTINPWKTSKLQPKFKAGERFYTAMMAYEEDKSFKTFFNTRWPVNPNTRSLVFIFQDAQNGNMAIRSLTDLAPK